MRICSYSMLSFVAQIHQQWNTCKYKNIKKTYNFQHMQNASILLDIYKTMPAVFKSNSSYNPHPL